MLNSAPKKKKAAYRAVSEALRNGTLVRPAVCETCGKQARVQGHHEDYDKPLVLAWLCRWCHWKVHAVDRGLPVREHPSRAYEVIEVRVERTKAPWTAWASKRVSTKKGNQRDRQGTVDGQQYVKDSKSPKCGFVECAKEKRKGALFCHEHLLAYWKNWGWG